jgi:hypothetical protein
MKKRSRRSIVALAVLSVILVIGIGASAYGVNTWIGYFHQEGGESSHSYVGWYVADAPAATIRNLGDDPGIFNLQLSQLAVWAERTDLSGVGTKAEPTAVAVLMGLDKCALTVTDSQLYAFGTQTTPGPQVVYSTGSAASVDLTNCTIYGDAYSAHGLYTQNASTMRAEKCVIITGRSGPGGAAVATGYDNGGFITTHACDIHSWGTDNAAGLYSSGALFANESKVYAHESEAAWSDGGGDLTLGWRPSDEKYAFAVYNSYLYSYKSYGVSFAKSPITEVGDDTRSRFAMVGGYLEAAKELFYCPNSLANIVLWQVDTSTGNGVVLTTKWTGSGPGGGVPTDTFKPGSRESDVVLEAIDSHLRGDIITDVDEYTRKDSVVTLALSGWASFQGAVNRINKGQVNVLMAKESEWNVTANSYVATLNVPTINNVKTGYTGRNYYDFQPDLSNIHSNGHTVYYDQFANPSIEPRKYQLPGGGWLVPAAPVGVAALWDLGL